MRPPVRLRSVVLSLSAAFWLAASGPVLAQTGAPAPAAPVGGAQITVTPPSGPSEQSVVVRATGLPGNAELELRGGQNPAALQPLASVLTDGSGQLQTNVEIPGGSQYGQDYLIELAAGGEVLGRGAYRVESRVAPSN